MDFWGVELEVPEYYSDYLNADSDVGECSAEGLQGHNFVTADYIVFGVNFALTAAIGAIYGCIVSRQSTASEYFMGNRQMHYFPVAMSLISSLLSAVSILGNPTEMYNYGAQLYLFCLAFLFSGPLAVNIFLPVYENLKITSAYEYINLRFHNSIRIFFSLAFLLQGLIYCSMAIYAPSLALAQVTKMKVYVVVLITFSVCVFYGSIGGVKAIIWSDTLQLLIMFATLLALIIRGTILAGGVDVVWNDSLQSGRIELFNFDPDPTIRQTFWSVFVGGTVYWTAITAANQNTIQRFLSLPSIRDANKAVFVATVGKILIYTVLFYIGMLIYSTYKDCDPVSSKMVRRDDQLMPLYIMDVMEVYPGVPGLLISSIFSTSIGAVATMLNGMSAVTVRDVVQGLFKKNLTDVQAGTLSKFLCLGYGLVSLGFMFFIADIGGLLQSAFSLTGIVAGVALGAFSLGLFLPWANWKGALGGTICSLLFMIWVSWGTVAAVKHGHSSILKKPLSVEGCLCNATLEIPHGSSEEVFPLYKVSYLWYTSMGTIVSIITGMIISGIAGFQDPRDLDQALISPVAQWVFNKLPQKMRNLLRLPIYDMAKKRDSCLSHSDSSFEIIDSRKCNEDIEG